MQHIARTLALSRNNSTTAWSGTKHIEDIKVQIIIITSQTIHKDHKDLIMSDMFFLAFKSHAKMANCPVSS